MSESELKIYKTITIPTLINANEILARKKVKDRTQLAEITFHESVKDYTTLNDIENEYMTDD
jgi:hypothetical protein